MLSPRRVISESAMRFDHSSGVASPKVFGVAAEANGGASRAIHWWQLAAAADPLNARLAASLIRARGAAGDVAGKVGQTAGEVVERGQMVARQAGMQFEDMLESNPLALGLVALGAGAAIGVMVPETRQEHQILGDVSDKVTDTVSHTASETMDKVEKVATKATDTAKQQAKSEGLVK